MTIKRLINGEVMEFELTQLELFDAYEEQQHKFDIQGIDDFFLLLWQRCMHSGVWL